MKDKIMQCHYFKTIFMSLLIFLPAGEIMASSGLIEDERMLQCFQDEVPQPEIEEYVLKKADSLKFAETGERFSEYPSVSFRHLFSRMPSIELYSLAGGEYCTNNLKNNYQYVLFNFDDSTMYHFGGNSSQFSKVIKNYLSQNFNPEFIMELLYIFVNTVNESYYYFKIEEIQDFKDRYDDGLSETIEIDEREAKFINKYVRPININDNNDSLEIEFYTWHKDLGYPLHIFDYWKFKVTKEKIVLLERKKLKPVHY